MPRPPLALLVAATTVLVACAAPPAHSDGDGDPVAMVHALIAADRQRGLDAALRCYSNDIVWLPPNAAEMRGRDAVAARYRTMFASFDPHFDMDVVEQGAAGDSRSCAA